MSEEEIITNNKPEEFDIKSIKTFEEMKEELGDKYEKYMYDCNIEFLKSFYEKDLQLYDLQSQLDIANKKYEELQYDIREERHLIPLTEKLEVVSILNDTRDKLKVANNKLKEVKEELIDTRKECFNQMAEKYEEDGESNEAHFLNFQVLPSIDKSLSIIGE